GPGTSLVKRIIGLPGEEIVLFRGRVYINKKLLSETYLANSPDAQDTAPMVLAPDHYYVMGDNRNFSDDSRANGPISEKDIRGRIKMILWPMPRIGGL
ncbi:MAG: signal peptidase I, partial [Armatimonadetes bacterium]|nr:signal peptidase I [Armatimonadota bacterium]